MKKYLSLIRNKSTSAFAAAGVLFTVLTTNKAFANTDQIFQDTTSTLNDIRSNLTTIGLAIGGLIFICLAIAAMFGKVSWKWVFMVLVGIFGLGVVDLVLNFLAPNVVESSN